MMRGEKEIRIDIDRANKQLEATLRGSMLGDARKITAEGFSKQLELLKDELKKTKELFEMPVEAEIVGSDKSQ